MMHEEEFKIISKLYSDGIRATKWFREEHSLPLEKCTIEERFSPLLKKYYEITGFEETVPAAIIHHRISLYGSACKRCGKPLRTPEATFCAACGQPAS